MFKKQLKFILTCGITLLVFGVNAQSFVPSAQQIEQFKNLPRAQQEQLAKQMGFDLSLLEKSSEGDSSTEQPEVDFIPRELDGENISKKLAKQSTVEKLTVDLKPFGYDIFESREEASVPIANLPVPSNYTIGPGDSVKLQLFGKESGSFELVVNNQGDIDIPDLGPLSATGVTFAELKELIKQRYDEQKIGVSPFISMGQLRTIQIFLVGEVYRPGPLIINSLSTITTALINSGGVSELGSLRNIELKREGKTVTRFDLYSLIAYGDTSNDVRLEQGDVLFVPTAKNIVSLEGQVRRPAIYEMKDTESVSDLLMLSGGFLPTADKTSIQIVRSSGSRGLSIININNNNKQVLETQLTNGDFIRVPKAKQEFNNAILISGAIDMPSVIANTNLSLTDIVSSDNLLANTDLQYALLLRKERFDTNSTIIQFKPKEVIDGKFNLELHAYDELIFFNRVTNNTRNDDTALVAKDLQSGEGELENEEASFLQEIENKRFTSEIFDKKTTTDLSREKLLAPVLARLKSEASDKVSLQLFEITGQVKYPGVYPLATNASLQNIIDAAGGLTESAHLKSAEITSVEVINGLSEVKHSKINLLEQLSLEENQQIKLQSKDVLNIVQIPQWYENNTITLRGEVIFPGVYQISEGETLSSVIERAGGLTPNATVRAAVFTRSELKEKERANIDKAIEDLRQQLANNNLSTSQFSRTIDYDNATKVLNDLTSVEPLGRMVIDLNALLLGSVAADIEVKNGDVLSIPNITPAISIIGEVFVATTHLYDVSLSLNDYIQLAGGVREYGDESKLYVVRANGSVFVPKTNFWFASSDDTLLQPGDTIVVPRDVTNYDNISLWQGVTQILYQTAVALAAVGSL